MTQECFILQGDYNLIIVDKKSLSTQHQQNRIVYNNNFYRIMCRLKNIRLRFQILSFIQPFKGRISLIE